MKSALNIILINIIILPANNQVITMKLKSHERTLKYVQEYNTRKKNKEYFLKKQNKSRINYPRLYNYLPL